VLHALVCLRLSASHRYQICTCCASFGFAGLKSTPFSIPLFCVCVSSVFHLYVSPLYVSAYFILTSPIFVCLFLSFSCVCLSSLCVSLSSLCVWFFRLYVSAFVSLLETTSFYNGFFFPSWLCVVPSFCSLVLYFGIVCGCNFCCNLLYSQQYMFSFFSLIVVSTLSFFAFTPYLDVTCVVPFTSIVIFYLVSSTRCLQELLHGFYFFSFFFFLFWIFF